MRFREWFVRFIGWRWTPALALVVGSLVFVAVAVAVVPDDLGMVDSGADRLSRGRASAASDVDASSDRKSEARSRAQARRRAASAPGSLKPNAAEPPRPPPVGEPPSEP